MPPLNVLRYCAAEKLPFVTIGHMSSEYFGSDDGDAAQYRSLLPRAQRCYFVSLANLRIFEKQIGCLLPNAEVIRNPFKVAYDTCPLWPSLGEGEALRIAHVGRLHMPSKGQDLLVEALAGQAWRSRNWRLTLYGDGPMRDILERLIERAGLSDKIHFGGFVESVEQIWAENHLLVMPSRYEGLPLAIVEAMLCSRPVLATDVAGHTEVIEDGVTGFVAAYPTARSLAEALERVWENRHALETIGARAGVAIRARVPRDPLKAFAEKLKVAARADRRQRHAP
jgi:glycosyltransferase involved in cell wall biosynthesis